MAQTGQQLRKLNVVVSNAVEQTADTDVATPPNEQFEDTLQVKLFPLAQIVKAALPHPPEGSAIVVTSSLNTYKGNQQLVDYTPTRELSQLISTPFRRAS